MKIKVYIATMHIFWGEELVNWQIIGTFPTYEQAKNAVDTYEREEDRDYWYSSYIEESELTI